MVETLFVASDGAIASTANTTQYWNIGNSTIQVNNTETTVQNIVRNAGTLKQLYCRLTANSLSGGSLTVRTRKNAANGGQSITISAGATGVFEDPTGTDTIAAGDKINIQTVPPATGTFSMILNAVTFIATTNTVSVLTSLDDVGQSFSTASTTTYCALGGFMAFNATESRSQATQKKAGSLEKLAVNIISNARTTDTTFRSRKNTANGNMVITVGSGGTGFFEEVSPATDTIAVDDLANYSITTGTGTQAIVTGSIKCEFISTAGNGQLINAWNGGTSVADNTTRYTAISGDTTVDATESNQQMDARQAFTLSNATIRIVTNTVSSASTCRSRKNAANGGQTVSITGNTTGVFTDGSGTDVCVATDDINYQIVVPTVAGSQTIAFTIISMWSFLAAGIPQTVFVEWEES